VDGTIERIIFIQTLGWPMARSLPNPARILTSCALFVALALIALPVFADSRVPHLTLQRAVISISYIIPKVS
jgi:biotin transporter BioY